MGHNPKKWVAMSISVGHDRIVAKKLYNSSMLKPYVSPL